MNAIKRDTNQLQNIEEVEMKEHASDKIMEVLGF